MSLLPVFREALRRVDPEQVDHPYLHVQERVFCYELYHQLRLMEVEERAKGRELFHPVRLALTGRPGEGDLDRVVLLLDDAAAASFSIPVKTARTRIIEFCSALD